MINDISIWHKWFAWYPVRDINGKIRFLTHIDRRFSNNWFYNDGHPYWEYK
jgi:hypothetical protein